MSTTVHTIDENSVYPRCLKHLVPWTCIRGHRFECRFDFRASSSSSTDRKEYLCVCMCVSSELRNNIIRACSSSKLPCLWPQLSGMTTLKDVRGKLTEYLHTCRYADIILSLWCASSFVGLVRDDHRYSVKSCCILTGKLYDCVQSDTVRYVQLPVC